MQFTLRQGHGPSVVLWALITALCAISGPFGTLDVLGFGGRVIYWGGIVGVSVIGSVLINQLGLAQGWQRVVVWLAFAIVISSTVYFINGAIFGGRASSGSWLYLTGIVGATVLVVHGVIWLIWRTLPQAAAAAEDAPDIAARFQRRLPLEARGPLVRIEAQDHYLNVVTQNGSALILLRLSEAVAELEDAGGLQTHRSHWVSLDAVKAHQRVDGRDILEMWDGTEVPVARTRRDAAKEAGLF